MQGDRVGAGEDPGMERVWGALGLSSVATEGVSPIRIFGFRGICRHLYGVERQTEAVLLRPPSAVLRASPRS